MRSQAVRGQQGKGTELLPGIRPVHSLAVVRCVARRVIDGLSDQEQRALSWLHAVEFCDVQVAPAPCNEGAVPSEWHVTEVAHFLLIPSRAVPADSRRWRA